MGRIYLITNTINNKKYVGQTIKRIEQRFKEHIYYSRKEENIRNMPLAYAMRKHGEKNFKVSLLEECNKEDLNKREIYWIEKLKTHSDGYNATKGGSNGNKIDLDLEDVKETYLRTKSLRRTAKKFNVDKDCISHRIKAMGLELYTRADQVNSIAIYEDEEDEKPLKIFKTKREAAQWFIDKDIPRSRKIESVRKSLVNNSHYYGYYIKEVSNDKI